MSGTAPAGFATSCKEWQFLSGLASVRATLIEVVAELRPLYADSDLCDVAQTVLGEALNNIVEHAYPGPSHTGPIDIACAQLTDGLTVEICDKGHALPNERLPTGRLASVDVDLKEMPEGGFGWFLIQQLAKDVSYQRVDDQNRLRMRLAVVVTS